LQRWLLIAVTLERLSFAEGIVLARTCIPMIRRQPELAEAALVVDDGVPVTPCSDDVSVFDESIGTIMNPCGRSEMHEGSSPLIASWIESTSIVV
jgi:hypothetical protein